MRVPDKHFVNFHTLSGPYPDGFETAIFALGCFWGAERIFWQIPGVYTTAVGYAGGVTPNPTYQEACSGRTGHTEAVLVVFDPKVVALAHALGRVVSFPEGTQQLVVRNDLRIKHHQHCFGVTSPTAACLLVRGVRCDATRVTNRSRVDARDLPEDALGSPKATEGEDRGLETLGVRTAQRVKVHEVLLGNAHRFVTTRKHAGRINH